MARVLYIQHHLKRCCGFGSIFTSCIKYTISNPSLLQNYLFIYLLCKLKPLSEADNNTWTLRQTEMTRHDKTEQMDRYDRTHQDETLHIMSYRKVHSEVFFFVRGM